MAYALGLLKGEADLEECPHLAADQRNALRNIEVTDWRESLINTLKNDIQPVDFYDLYKDIGADYRDGCLHITCLGVNYTVNHEGEITTEGYINPWIKILLLHYIRTGGSGEPTGRWVSFSELKSGMFKAASFLRDCEEPFRELLDGNFEMTEAFLLRLGARRVQDQSSDRAWTLNALPKVPILILYWLQDREVEIAPSRATILFDSTADRFLDVEALIFLIEGLVHIMRRIH
jgi:hypothetical protein